MNSCCVGVKDAARVDVGVQVLEYARVQSKFDLIWLYTKQLRQWT